MAHGSVYAFYAVNDTKNTKCVKATCHCMQHMPLYATYAIVCNKCHCMQQMPLYATYAIVAKYRNLEPFNQITIIN